MAKGKAKSEGSTEAAAGSTETNGANGAILFEKMPDDFAIPARTRGGAWDEAIEKLLAKENKGKVVKLYSTTKDNSEATYTRAKAIKQALERKKVTNITVAVRLHEGQSVLLAQAS